MTVGLIIMGALLGLFVAGPIAWNLAGLILGEESLAWRIGCLAWGLTFGVLGTLLGTVAAIRAEKRLDPWDARRGFFKRLYRRRV